MADQRVLFDQKWKKFLGRGWLFRLVPFVDFVLAAGSMAMGNVRPDSDFDVIVGTRYGRIFITRLFCILAFGLFGWRRKKLDHKESAADKICLNHFVTEKSYRLSPPHSRYWKKLYVSLVPVFGESRKLNQFWTANQDWLGKNYVYTDDLRHKYRTSSILKRIAERCLSGRLGNWLEAAAKSVQIWRIEAGLRAGVAGYKPRIIYNAAELEFHPDTRRIEILEKDL